MSSNVKLSVGALVVSGWASFLSFGVIVAVVFHYFLRFGNDKLLYKIIVTACMLLCMGDTVISAMWCYRWSTTYFGDSASLLVTPKEAIALLFLFPPTALIVQLWFAHRIWMISMRKNLWLPGIIAFLATGSWVITLWMFGALVKRHSSLVDDSSLVFPVGYAWLVGDIVTDICIFVGLTYYTELRTRKDRVHHILSPASLVALGYRMIECNALPLIAQITLLILFKTNVGLYYIFTDMTIAKIYTFSLLVSLNARGPIKAMEGISSKSQQQSDPNRSRFNHTAVQIRQDVHVMHDDEPTWHDSESGKIEDYEVGKAVLVD